MRSSWMKAACAALYCIAFLLPASARAQISEAQAERLMQLSGLNRSLDVIAGQFRKGFEEAAKAGKFGPGTNLAQLQSVISAGERAFDGVTLRGSVRTDFSNRLSLAHFVELDRWLDSALGRRITALEDLNADPSRDVAADVQAGLKLYEAATPARRKLLEDLAALTRAVDSTTNVIVATTAAMVLGSSRANSTGAPLPTPEAIREAIEAQRPLIQEQFTVLVQGLFAQTYSPLTDQELQAYVNFVATPVGRDYTLVSLSALERALSEAGFRFGQWLPQPGASGA
jgi:hypothetical protein